jgi:hypothetical protein
MLRCLVQLPFEVSKYSGKVKSVGFYGQKISEGVALKLKYESEIAAYDNCPPSDCGHLPNRLRGYRFTQSDPPTKADFVPVALENPVRTFADAHSRCSSLALSFFDSVRSAEKKRDGLTKQSKKLRKKFAHVAECEIHPADGLCSLASRSGHFSVHESEQADIFSRSCVVRTF